MCVYVCVCCVVHWHCSAQLSMFNMEKRYRNKIIIIIMPSPMKCGTRQKDSHGTPSSGGRVFPG